jgi:hypothetical protein
MEFIYSINSIFEFTNFEDDITSPTKYPAAITTTWPSNRLDNSTILPSSNHIMPVFNLFDPNFSSRIPSSPTTSKKVTNFPSSHSLSPNRPYSPEQQAIPILPTKANPQGIPVWIEILSPEKSSNPFITFPEASNTTLPTSIPVFTSVNDHIPIHNTSANPTPLVISVKPNMKPNKKYMNPTRYTRFPSFHSSNQITSKPPENSLSQLPMITMSPAPFFPSLSIPKTNGLLPSPIPSQITLSSRNPVTNSVKSLIPSFFTEMGKCTVDKNGLFGSMGHSIAIIIRFKYELEITPNSSFKYSIIHVEYALNNILLPVLFPDKCNIPMMSIDTIMGKAIGISPKPDDTILHNGDCAQQKNVKNKCRVVQGELTIFIDDQASGFNSIFSVVLTRIKQTMANNSLLLSSKGIERVTFLTQNEIANVEAEPGSPLSDGQIYSADSLASIILGVIAAVIALALLIAFLLWHRNRGERLENDDEERQNFDGAPSAQANDYSN